MRKVSILSFLLTFILLLSGQTFSQGLPVGVPRHETFIVDQIFRYSVTQNFNIWTPGAGPTPVRHGLISDTF